MLTDRRKFLQRGEWSPREESNPQHELYKSPALPVELQRRNTVTRWHCRPD
jgi:hypothetical protein